MFKNHPKGLLAAAISNMGERFGYYITKPVPLSTRSFIVVSMY